MNGKTTVTPLAALTVEDRVELRALPDEERKHILFEALDKADKSPIGARTRQEIKQVVCVKNTKWRVWLKFSLSNHARASHKHIGADHSI